MMDGKVTYFIKAETVEQKIFVNKQDKCPLCEDLLIFAIFDIGLNTIEEKAYCKTCDILTRTKEHVLH